MQDQIDETNGLKTRLGEVVERKVTSHGEEIESNIADIAVLDKSLDGIMKETNIMADGKHVLISEVKQKQTTLADEIAGRLSEEAQKRDNLRDADLKERDERNNNARDRQETAMATMMGQLMAMVQASVAPGQQERTPPKMDLSGNRGLNVFI